MAICKKYCEIDTASKKENQLNTCKATEGNSEYQERCTKCEAHKDESNSKVCVFTERKENLRCKNLCHVFKKESEDSKSYHCGYHYLKKAEEDDLSNYCKKQCVPNVDEKKESVILLYSIIANPNDSYMIFHLFNIYNCIINFI